jgi:DNA invertase Pin-like site-specific DNA recombinase
LLYPFSISKSFSVTQFFIGFTGSLLFVTTTRNNGPRPRRNRRVVHGDNLAPPEICVAEYIRMSTERQAYSIESQQIAIATYAAAHKIKIVRSYIDPGKSGLRIEHRHALRQLIDDVQNGRMNFGAILVYDVSRWGRFQDIDESAYYEFICKRAGVPILYCAEQFENNNSSVAQLIKGLKRVMAGEFSRELSVKVFDAQKRVIERGRHRGGNPAYGLRRLQVDEQGRPRGVLSTGERRHFETYQVILTQGPYSEVRTVRRIFRLFVIRRMRCMHIAQLLNNEGVPNAIGKRWTYNNVLRVLTNEKYIGNTVYARTSQKMLGPMRRNPPELWIRAIGTTPRMIDPHTFALAQKILGDSWWSYTDYQLLDRLTATFCKYGYLNTEIIRKSKSPAVETYTKRFGKLKNAYRLIGYKQVRGYHHCKPALLRPMHRNLIARLIFIVEQEGGTLHFDETTQSLQLDGKLVIGTAILPYLQFDARAWGWTLRYRFFPDCDIVLAGRLNTANTKLLGYYLIPRSVCPRTILQFTEQNLDQFRSYKLRSLQEFYSRCKAIGIRTLD